MFNDIPTTLQRLRTLPDIASASKSVKDEDYFQLKRDYDNLVNAISEVLVAINDGYFGPQLGTGSPEGAIAANYSLLYIDTDVNQLHYNPTYGANTGWIAL